MTAEEKAAEVEKALCKHLDAVALAGTYDSYDCPNCGTVKARDFDRAHPSVQQQLGEE